MKSLIAFAMAVLFIVSGPASAKSNFAKTDQWVSGWAQGADEYSAASKDDSVYVLISCDGTEPKELWFGMFTQSSDQPISGSVSVTIDGKTYHNPFSVASLQNEATYRAFWSTLRDAKTLSLTVGKTTKEFTTNQLSKVLPEYGTPDFNCKLSF